MSLPTPTSPPTLAPDASTTGFDGPVPTTPTVAAFDPAASSDGNQGVDAGSNRNGIGSSASLYLYTFLATLLVLLAVSAAIIMRSYVLRRRQRRMMEEAIRNGTWVSPTPLAGGLGGGGRYPRVDLSKKPDLWEAYCGGGLLEGKSSVDYASSEKNEVHGYKNRMSLVGAQQEWDNIKPFYGAYVGPWGGASDSLGLLSSADSKVTSSTSRRMVSTPPGRQDSHPGTSPPNANDVPAMNPYNNVTFYGAPAPPRAPSPPVSTYERLATYIRGPRTTHWYNPSGDVPSSNTTAWPYTRNQFVPAAPPVPPPDPDNVIKASVARGEVPTIRVAVLIAMPSPQSSARFSGSKLRKRDEGKHPLEQGQRDSMEDEESLPHIEFGIADMPVSVTAEGVGDEGVGGHGSGAVTGPGGVGKRWSQDSEDVGGYEMVDRR